MIPSIRSLLAVLFLVGMIGAAGIRYVDTAKGAAGLDTAKGVASVDAPPGLAYVAAATTIPAASPAAAQNPPGRWLGPDLQPLPFTEDELLEVLRSGEILERESIDIGINGIDRLVLERDGVRLRAGFRVVDIRERDRRVGSEFYLLFRDSYVFECAAYELARLLGIPNVPPTVARRIDGVDGSVQLWIEDLFEDTNAARSPDGFGWSLQLSTMILFDSLIYNVDRNPGNIKIDHQYRLWMIDHTRAFQAKSAPFQVERVNTVRRDLWERLRALQPEDFERAFSGFLEPAQVRFFLDRRAALLERIQALIAERSEGAVILEPRGAGTSAVLPFSFPRAAVLPLPYWEPPLLSARRSLAASSS